MSSIRKNRKYHFKSDWEELYCVIEKNDKCLCLICNKLTSGNKKHNIERHFKTMHSSFDLNYPPASLLRKTKIDEFKSRLTTPETCLTNCINSKSKNATMASFKICHLLAQSKKPFSYGEFIKKAFLMGGDALYEGFSNKGEIISAIKEIQLSNSTATERIQVMSNNLQSQLRNDIERCKWFSLQFDELTEMTDTAYLAIYIRMVFVDFSLKEELLTIFPIQKQTRGEDVFNHFKNFLTKIEMPLLKLSAIITDGAPAMVDCNDGFISHCKRDEFFPIFIHYHSIIHQEVLCARILSFEHVINLVFKIIDKIRKNPLSHGIFKAIVENNDSSQTDLIDIRWLIRGKGLARFFDLRGEIKKFFISKRETFEQFDDLHWLMDLAFLTDICEILNSLNLELQNENKDIADLISSIKTSKAKIQLRINNLSQNSLDDFPRMKKVIGENIFDLKLFIIRLEKLLEQFESRFQQFSIIEPVVIFFLNPFNTQLDVSEITNSIAEILQEDTSEIENEILSIQNDIVLKSFGRKYTWNQADRKKYPLLRKGAYKIKSYFGSTHLCESLFSAMNTIKSDSRSQITDANLDDCLRLGLSSYIPNFETIVNEMQCQISH